MRKQFHILLFILLGCHTQLSAQDIHFSQFNRSYLNLNPALNGDYNNDYRFNGNFRNQWSSVSQPFQTFSISAEAKNPFISLKGLHFGLILYNDEAGLGGLQTTQANLNLAYSTGLNYDSTLVFAFGLQSGLTSRSINFNAFSFDSQFDGIQFDPTLANGENFDQSSYSHFNLHSGIALRYLLEERKLFKVGASFYNLTSPNQSFQGTNVFLDLRTNIYIEADYYLSRKMDIMPALLVSRQGEFRESLFGANLRYRFNDNPFLKRNLYAGVWYRNQDAIIASLGMDYNQWQVGLSYDINTSSLEVASNNRGGLEISLTYQFSTFKPNIRNYKQCPTFL
ncbi:MAG: PorP/SprF family type IX secretion system membrane protein [Vicingaceae bacterium]